jgi:hypothetical protein
MPVRSAALPSMCAWLSRLVPSFWVPASRRFETVAVRAFGMGFEGILGQLGGPRVP